MSKSKQIVPESFVGLLYVDGAYQKTLPPGRHLLKRSWFDHAFRSVTLVDMRERSLTIKGQEILTADKVAIRVSLLVYFRVKDAECAAHNVSSYEERIYEDVQLAARRFLASRELDAILSDRNEISDNVRDDVSEAAESYGVEILRADVKDLVFPGNLREIMNQVLETERRAEAKLIDAKKDAEAQIVRSEAESRMALKQLEAKMQQARVAAEADQERARIHLESEVAQAQALAEYPMLLRLRQIDALKEMAARGAKFTVGLSGTDLELALKLDDAGRSDNGGQSRR